MSELLHAKIESVRRKQILFSAGSGIAAMVGSIILLLAVEMLVDYNFELPYGVRAGFLAVDVTVLVWLLFSRILAPVLFGPDDEELALQVEHAIPDFRTRLIASIQLGRPGAVPVGTSKSLAGAMIRQTEDFAVPLDFAAIVSPDPLLKVSAMAGFILILGLSSFIYSAHLSSDLLKRALLSNTPVPRQTRVNCLSRNKIVAIGDPVSLEAIAEGVIPSSGRIRLDYKSGREQTFTLNPDAKDARRFRQIIENVQESFSYCIYLNDGRSEWFKVQASARPVVTSLDLVQVYPKYTRRADERRSPGDLLLLAGSQLKVQVKANKPIKNGYLHLVGLSQDIAVAPKRNEPNSVVGSIDRVPPRGLTGFSIRLIDELGIASNDQTVYPIDVLIDRDPTVHINWPDRKEELATQQAKILIGFEASDDYGIARILLHYRVDKQVTPETLVPGQEQLIELDLTKSNGQDMRHVKRRYELNLPTLKTAPLEGSAVEYWLEVQDGNDVTGPGKAFSEHFRARIVSEIAKRADLMNRLNDQLGTIDAVTGDEEKLNQTLGALIFEKPRD